MNFTQPNPTNWLDRLTALELQTIAGLPNVDQTVLGGRVFLTPLATPGAPSIVVTGGAAGSFSYAVVAVLGTGTTPAGAGGSTAAGPTTLDTTHFNTLSWAAVAGATSYNIYRTAGGATQGLIANVLAPTLTLKDNALVADGTTAPTINTTAVISAVVQETQKVYSANGAITQLGQAVITKGSLCALTLAAPVAGAPSAGGMDGMVLLVISTTAFAHTLTTPSNKINGSGSIATFAATVGLMGRFVAYNGVWYISSANVTIS